MIDIDAHTMARIYRVLFLDAPTERAWENLIAHRKLEYSQYLNPPNTAAGTAQYDWSIKTGQMADTIARLDAQWHRTIRSFIAAAVQAGCAVDIAQEGE